MTTEEIKQLLEKYYDGETSLQEEHILKEFFSRENVPLELLPEKDIFNHYIQSSVNHLPAEDFAERIIQSLDGQEYKLKLAKKGKLFTIISGVAASLVILTGIYIILSSGTKTIDTYSDPELAYNEAIKILYNVSNQMNRGMQSLDKIGMMQEAATESFLILGKPSTIVKEKMKPLGLFNNAYDIIDNRKNGSNEP